MRKVLCAAVAVIIDIPDHNAAIGAPLAKSPLDELTARLRQEACHGRDSRRPDFTLPGVNAWMAAAYQECSARN